MNKPNIPMKKPSGCLKWSGCMLTIASALLITFFVWMIVDSEKDMDKSRQEYYESHKEYEDALKAYEADSTLFKDSLGNYVKPEYHPRGHIGVNIGAAFFVGTDPNRFKSFSFFASLTIRFSSVGRAEIVTACILPLVPSPCLPHPRAEATNTVLP